MDTDTILTKFMDMLIKRDNALIKDIQRHLDDDESEVLDAQTLMDMFTAANKILNAEAAKLDKMGARAPAKKTKKKRGPSGWTIFGAILREFVTTAVKEGERGEGTPFVVAGKCLGQMWKSEDNAQRKSDLEEKVGELTRKLLEENEVLEEDEAKLFAKKLFPKNGSLTYNPDEEAAMEIKFDKALREKVVTVFMEKFGRIPIEEPAKPKKKAKGAKAKAKKDPNKPKRAKSAYIFFCSAMRAIVKEDMGDAKATEVTKELGKRWRELDEDDKVQYQDLADKDKERYAEEMEVYSSSSGGSGAEEGGAAMDVDTGDDEVDVAPKTPKKKKKTRVPGAPKKKKKKSKSPVKKPKSPVVKKPKQPEEEQALFNLLGSDSSDDDE